MCTIGAQNDMVISDAACGQLSAWKHRGFPFSTGNRTLHQIDQVAPNRDGFSLKFPNHVPVLLALMLFGAGDASIAPAGVC